MILSTKGMRQGNVGEGLEFCHLQDPQIGLPLVELIDRIMVGAEVLWQPALTSNGAAEHATEWFSFPNAATLSCVRARESMSSPTIVENRR
jgi:hypothetical protein